MTAIREALGEASSIVNVGAGTGSYEPAAANVVAVEPSEVMIRQRASDAAPLVRAVAEQLPFANGTFHAALAVLTVHHWSDVALGLRELRRVAHRQVVLAFDAEEHARFWLLRDYLPEVARSIVRRTPTLADLSAVLAPNQVRRLPVPRDMVDGVLAANWARPSAYLEPRIRRAASGLAEADPGLVEARVAQLRRDLQDGTWAERNASLDHLAEYDAGYYLLIAEP